MVARPCVRTAHLVRPVRTVPHLVTALVTAVTGRVVTRQVTTGEITELGTCSDTRQVNYSRVPVSVVNSIFIFVSI